VRSKNAAVAARGAATAETARRRPRFPQVHAPMPLLSGEDEKRLTTRQRELLDQFEAHVAKEGMTERTMAEVAAHMNCSLRTLYGIASTKDELLKIVADRRMRRIGRQAMDALDERMTPMQMLRTYLASTNEAVLPTTVALNRQLVGVAGARHMLGGHGSYVLAMTQHLLDQAVAVGEIAPIDTVAVAHVLGSLGVEFSRPEVAEMMPGEPKATADAVAEIILRGLAQPTRPTPRLAVRNKRGR